MMYLVYADLEGEAAVTADAVLAAAAISDLQGDGSLEAIPQVAYDIEAAMQGDAATTTVAVCSYAADSTPLGDAQVTARALPEDELAIDLYGNSIVGAAAEMSYLAEGSLQGQAITTVVALLRPAFLPEAIPQANVEPERMIGYQPGRETPPQIDKLVVVTKR
jgi:hypothetical protein